ncbi:hypothetical protein Murka_0067 [Xanthomonas phage Murka]|nr:hypothetical protein Murka_0067 [Xanthomonas phage Murka]
MASVAPGRQGFAVLTVIILAVIAVLSGAVLLIAFAEDL